MGNTEGFLSENIEEINEYEEIIEDIIEPLAREGFVSELSTGITLVFYNQALEVLGVASLAVIRVVANNEESGEEVFEDYDSDVLDQNIWDAYEDFYSL
jgi:hypothetical protein